MNRHAPFKKMRVKNRSRPRFSPELSDLFLLRNKAWPLARWTKEASHWASIKKIRNTCTPLVRKTNSNYYMNLVRRIYSNSNNSNLTVSVPTHVKFDDCLLYDHSEICSVFNSHSVAAGHISEDEDNVSPSNNVHLLNNHDFKSCLSVYYRSCLSQRSHRGSSNY